MEGIVLTTQQNTDMFNLIDEHYASTDYGSFANFVQTEKRNIVTMPIKNDLFVLSPTVLEDPAYAALKAFIFGKINNDITIRIIDPEEIIETDEF
jgi:hypothetical protein